MATPIRVAIVGLGFGAEFIPIYQAYPGVEMYAICCRNKDNLNKIGDKHHITTRYTNYDDLLRDDKIDAVHINSPIPDHASHTLKALAAGKHVACTVPMATSQEDCRKIVELQRHVNKIYMMMETTIYSREYLFVKEMYDKGDLGRIQFLRGSHQQDMNGWPHYWPGLPPMWYATHCVSPCLALMCTPSQPATAEHVTCHGSGRIREDLIAHYGSPFAIETATFRIKGTDVAAEVTRSLFDTARQYRESFDVYGSLSSFEWQQVEGGKHVIHTGGRPEPDIPRHVHVPDYAHLLPPSIQPFTQPSTIQDADHLSFVQGGGHGGSHPHLVHAFIEAILHHRPAFPDAPTSANWTMIGLCAHESAMKGGDKIVIPEM
eukprot:TRINITY_DN8577_c0_g1_i1.p1 TRINITY_DN8577_c0_g1~~TRINITY_DN8577_c0_g1_i1.p1  ORF type:complete len:388 (+),score=74.73 TRINITY_DN8577_c0_g1_i1:40-1164(+)